MPRLLECSFSECSSNFSQVTMSIVYDPDETLIHDLDQLRLSDEATSSVTNLEQTPTQENTKTEKKLSLLKKTKKASRELFPPVNPLGGGLEPER